MADLQADIPTDDFFSNLKRRRFFPFLFSYILGGFTVIQLTEWVCGRYGFSPFWTDAIFLFLVLLLPGVVVFIYNHGAPGPDTWKPYEKWALPLNVVLAIAIVFLGLRGKDLGKSQQTITVVDEDGQEEERIVPTANFVKDLTVFALTTEGDSVEWYNGAFSALLSRDLEQDRSIYVRGYRSILQEAAELGIKDPTELSLAQQRQIAASQYSNYFMNGSIRQIEDGALSAVISVYTAEDGIEYSRTEYQAADIFSLVDQVSKDFRKSLLVDNAITNTRNYKDLPASDLLTSDLEALRLFVKAQEVAYEENNFQEAVPILQRAIEIDPNSAEIHGFLGATYINLNQGDKKQVHLQKAIDLVQGLPERQELQIRKLYYMPADYGKIADVLDYYIELYPNDYQAYAELITYHNRFYATEKALDIALKAESRGHAGKNLLTLSRIYRSKGDSEKALDYFDKFAKEFPEKAKDLNDASDILIEQGRFEEAQKIIEQKAIFSPGESALIKRLADLADKQGNYDEADRLYRDAIAFAKSVQDSTSYMETYLTFLGYKGRYSEAIELSEQIRLLYRKFIPHISADLRAYGMDRVVYYNQIGRRAELEAAHAQLEKQYGGPNAVVDISCILTVWRAVAYEEYQLINDDFDRCKQVLVAMDGARAAPMMDLFQALGNDKHDAAKASMKEFIEVAGLPEVIQTLQMMLVYDAAGDYKAVLDEAEKTPEYTYTNMPGIYVYKARAHKALRQKDKARKVLDHLFKMWENADKESKYYQEALTMRNELG